MTSTTQTPTTRPLNVYAVALQVQDACNLSGVALTLTQVTAALWDEARATGQGTEFVNTHPAVTLILDKLVDLNRSRDPLAVARAYTTCAEHVEQAAQAAQAAQAEQHPEDERPAPPALPELWVNSGGECGFRGGSDDDDPTTLPPALAAFVARVQEAQAAYTTSLIRVSGRYKDGVECIRMETEFLYYPTEHPTIEARIVEYMALLRETRLTVALEVLDEFINREWSAPVDDLSAITYSPHYGQRSRHVLVSVDIDDALRTARPPVASIMTRMLLRANELGLNEYWVEVL